MIIGNTLTFALEHHLMEALAENGKTDFYGSLAVWVAGKQFTTHDWETWLTYVHTAVRYFPREHPNFFSDPAFVYVENYETKSAEDFCGLIDFYAFGIGRNYTPTNEEILIGGRLLKHEVGGVFDSPFCDVFPIYIVDIADGTRRIILCDRQNQDAIHECRLPRTEMENTLRDWCVAFEKDSREFADIWKQNNSHWNRVINFFTSYFYRKGLSDELEERKIWELQEKYARKHGLKMPSQEI